MRIRRSTALLAVMALLLAACGGTSDDTPAGGSDPGTTAPTELRLAIGGEEEETGYDPTLGWGRYGSPLFQSTLLRLDADLSIVNDLATDYEVSQDGLTWTVTIRDDALFSDGEPVTASDVAYTFTTALQSPGLTDLSVLARVAATSDTVVEFRLKEPQSSFVYRLAAMGIVPEHAHGPDYGQHPIGSGPFEFVEWSQGQQLIVKRNEKYYGTAPAFERIVFVFTDEDATLAAARAGEVEIAGVGSSLVTGDIDGYRLEVVPSIDNRGVSFPFVPDEGRTTDEGAPIGNDVTSDRAIRYAINIAADREALVKGVLRGYGSPATGPVDGAPWYEPASAIEDSQVEEARTVLAEAGWVDADGDGVVERDGVEARFNLLYPASDSVRQGLALALVDQIKPLGIHIQAKGATWDEIGERSHADAVMFGWGSHDPTEMFSLYHSRFAGIESWNPGFYRNAKVDAHLDAAMRATDTEEANAEWRAAQLDDDGNGFTAKGDAAWAWLVNLEHTYYVNTCLDLGAIHSEPHGHGWPITAGIEEWSWTC